MGTCCVPMKFVHLEGRDPSCLVLRQALTSSAWRVTSFVRGVAAHLLEGWGLAACYLRMRNAPSLVKLTVVGCRLMKIADVRS
jgi:hypothetical protein